MNHPILGQTALAYSPVIDRNRDVIATRLTVMPLIQGSSPDASALLIALADTWPEGGQNLWLNVASENLLEDLLQTDIPAHIYIEVPSFMASDSAHSAALLTLHGRGNTLLLKGRPLKELPREVLPCFKHAIIDYADDRRLHQGNADQPSIAPKGTVRSISHIQGGITSIDEMELSFQKGAVAVLGWPIDHDIEPSCKPADLPALKVIVQLIDHLHSGDDIDDLDDALKCWLALLLATTSDEPNMRPVMFAAVRRGLLMEELARLSGNDDMRHELLICGVFSLLDVMFRQPFNELLKTIPVPERVFLALAEQSGPYEPYFELLQALEAGIVYDIKEVADKLLLTFQDLNTAILKAMRHAGQLG